MDNDLVKKIVDFGSLLNYASTEHGNSKKQIGSCDDEIHEICHEIELEEMDPYRAFVLVMKIKEVAVRRREHVNDKLLLAPIKEFADNNKNLEVNLFKLSTAIKGVEKNIKNAKYEPVIRTDLNFSKKNLRKRKSNG